MKCKHCGRYEAQENDSLCFDCDVNFGTYGLSREEKARKRIDKTYELEEELKKDREEWKNKLKGFKKK